MDSCHAVGSTNATDPMLGGSGPHLMTPPAATQCETLGAMRSPLPMAAVEACTARTSCSRPCPCPCECVVYRYVPPPRTPSAKPPKVICPTKTPFDDRSIYRISYLPVCCCCVDRQPLITPTTLKPPCSPMICETTTRFDYPYWGCVERLNSCKPCHRRTVGEGCISDVTTFRNDYRPPMCTPIPPKVYPLPALTTPDVPMEGMSLMRASYMAPRCAEPRASYKRVLCYNCAPFQDCTLHRESYQPWPSCRPCRPPWARKVNFCNPDKPMENTSMYGSSYMPPGAFLQVPCSDLCYEEKMEAYDPCRVLGDKPAHFARGPMPYRQHTGLCTSNAPG